MQRENRILLKSFILFIVLMLFTVFGVLRLMLFVIPSSDSDPGSVMIITILLVMFFFNIYVFFDKKEPEEEKKL